MGLRASSRFGAAPKPENPDLVFLREGNLLYGEGVALRLSAKGENRIQDLSTQWQKLVLESEIDDQVGLSGSGLVAFASITFSAQSGF